MLAVFLKYNFCGLIRVGLRQVLCHVGSTLVFALLEEEILATASRVVISPRVLGSVDMDCDHSGRLVLAHIHDAHASRPRPSRDERVFLPFEGGSPVSGSRNARPRPSFGPRWGVVEDASYEFRSLTCAAADKGRIELCSLREHSYIAPLQLSYGVGLANIITLDVMIALRYYLE